MPSLRIEEEQVQEVAEHQAARLLVVEVRRRRTAAWSTAPRTARGWRTGSAPSSVSARRFTSANRTCSITCWLSLPPGTCSMLMTLLFGRGRRGDLGGPQHHGRARHLARQDDRLVADADRDVLAGKQRLQLLLERGDGRLDDDVVLRRAVSAPHDDQADRARPSCRRRGSRAAARPPHRRSRDW